MCPEPQLISIYLDGELPSPWREKLESHLAECSACREKLERFKKLFNKMSVQEEQKLMEETKNKVWEKLQSKHNVNARQPVQRMRSYNVWQRRVSIPIPAAAAAAVLLIFATAVWVRSGSSNNNINAYANMPIPVEAFERMAFNISTEEAIPNVMPYSDLSSVLQYLGGDRTEIIILQLPENNNFLRLGEPAIITAAEHAREPDTDQQPSNRRRSDTRRQP